MKLLTIILLLTTLTVQAQLPQDKRSHLLAGTLIGSWGTMLTVNEKPLKSFAWAMGPTVVIGGGKELVYDKCMGQGTPEWKDFGWTVIGGVTGFTAIRGFKWICEKIDKRKNKVYAH